MQCFSQETLMDINNWWQGGDSTPEGNPIQDLTTILINEPKNFEPNKYPSCIDLVFTD